MGNRDQVSSQRLLFHQRYIIKPITAKGVSIRYMIPWFNPKAGFSPSCCAVLVHSEHCPDAIQCSSIKIPVISMRENRRDIL